MHRRRKSRPDRAPAVLLALMTVALLAPTGAAHAQFGERPVGVVVAVPFQQYVPFLAANARHLRNVSLLYLSGFVPGDPSRAVAIVGVNQSNNTQPADSIFIPAPGATRVGSAVPAIYLQLNPYDLYTELTVTGAGATAVVQVKVEQMHSGTYRFGQTRWFQLVDTMLAPTVAANPGVALRIAHGQVTLVGGQSRLTLLVGVDGSRLRLAGPRGDLLAVLGLNANLVCGSATIAGEEPICEVTINP